MNKITRMMSLMLALALFLSVCSPASAQTTGTALEDLDLNTWADWLTYSPRSSTPVTHGEESAIGKTVQTNQDNVWIYKTAKTSPNATDENVAWVLEYKGEKMLVLGYVPGDANFYSEFYQVRYTRGDGVVFEGYVECRQLEICVEPEIEPDVEPWTPGESEHIFGFKTEGADGYVWERAPITGGEPVWETIPGENGSTLTIDTTSRDALGYIYRCTAKSGEETLAQSDDMRLIREDIALWMTAETSDELLSLAIRAKSLDSLLIDSGNMLLHIRTGEALAEFDPETGYLKDLTYYFDVAHYDVETGELMPLYSDVYGN